MKAIEEILEVNQKKPNKAKKKKRRAKSKFNFVESNHSPHFEAQKEITKEKMIEDFFKVKKNNQSYFIGKISGSIPRTFRR